MECIAFAFITKKFKNKNMKYTIHIYKYWYITIAREEMSIKKASKQTSIIRGKAPASTGTERATFQLQPSLIVGLDHFGYFQKRWTYRQNRSVFG